MATRRRFLAVLLTIVMLLQALPTAALADVLTFTSNTVEGSTYHKVEFQDDEGSVLATQYVENGANLVMPEDPAKEGNKFVGWFYGEEKVTAQTPVSADMTVKAKFAPITVYTVTVNYLLKEDQTSKVAESVVRSYTADDAEDEIISPAAVQVEGKGTLYPEQASVTVNPSTLTQEETVYNVYYINANAEYTIEYYAMAQSVDDQQNVIFVQEGATKIEGVEPTTGNGVVGQYPNVDAAEIPHYEFVEADAPQLVAGSDNVVKLYYRPEAYTLRYDSQGGSYVAPKTGYYNTEVVVFDVDPGEQTKVCGYNYEHKHTAKPSSDGAYDGEVVGCYKWTEHWFFGTYYSWDKNCGKSEHTHSDACYETIGGGMTAPVPTRQGYRFTGWYTDATCNTPADATMLLQDNATVYAGWEAETVNYTVVYMKQVYDNSTNDMHYVYHSSDGRTAKVGATVSASNDADMGKGYEYKDSSSATVKADGSTVVYAHYDLIEYTFVFDLYYDDVTLTMNGETYKNSEYSFNAVLGQDVSSIWPVDVSSHTGRYGTSFFKEWEPDIGGNNYASKRFEVTLDMLPSSGNIVGYEAVFGTGLKLKIVRYWLQDENGEYYTPSDTYSQTIMLSDGIVPKDIYGFTKKGIIRRLARRKMGKLTPKLMNRESQRP